MLMEAIFAMGCFWCGESEFRDHETNKPLKGIISIRVGYAGGTKPNPTYHSHEGYKEALKITYDPSVISYDQLLDIFWHNIDPFDADGQFCDKGFPYTAVIFFKDSEQKAKAEVTRDKIQAELKQEISTALIPYTTFYDAEEYHQDYKDKNPIRYKFYRWNCGRDQRLEEIWGAIARHDSKK
jgi:peptide-methionine (S)-S-oxide reductase